MSQPTIVAGINIPGINGGLAIAHSAIGMSNSSSTDLIKVVDKSLLGGLSLSTNPGDQIEGITINILFTNNNIILDNNLALRFGNLGEPIHIISNILNPGAFGDKATIFSYPQQNSGSIVTFVYRVIPKVYTGYKGTTEEVNYKVQMAINTQQVPYYPQEMDDFNNYVYSGIHCIPSLNDMSNKFSTDSYDAYVPAILEVIRTGKVGYGNREDVVITQRVTVYYYVEDYEREVGCGYATIPVIEIQQRIGGSSYTDYWSDQKRLTPEP